MTCSSAAVEPTSDSALPIRAELDGGPMGGTALGLRAPHSSEALWGPRDFAKPIRAELSGGPMGGKDGDTISYQRTIRSPFERSSMGARWEGRHLASALPKNLRFSGAPGGRDGDTISYQ